MKEGPMSDISYVAEPVATGSEVLPGHPQGAASIAYSPDGRWLVVGAIGGVIRLWDCKHHTPARTLVTGDENYNVAFSPTGQQFASTGYRRGVWLWGVWSGQRRCPIPSGTWSVALAFSLDGHTLAAGTQDGDILLFDAETGRHLRGFRSGGPVMALTYTPDGAHLISGCITIDVRDARTGDVVRTLEGHASLVEALATSPDGRLLTSASRDKTARVWDLQTGGLMHTLTHRTRDPIPAEWDPDARRWKRPLAAAAFAPDGRMVATGGADRVICLWDVATGGPMNTLTGHRGAVTDLTFSSDGRQLASASTDGSVRLWSLPPENQRGS
jgi:WD40 repeat protein